MARKTTNARSADYNKKIKELEDEIIEKKSERNKKTKKLEDELTETSYTLATQKNNMPVKKQNELMKLISNLIEALREEKIKNYDKDCKDAAQLKIMHELKRRNEEKDRKITVLERNSSKFDEKEINIKT